MKNAQTDETATASQKSPEMTAPLPSQWHDCEVAEKQIKELQRSVNNSQALAEELRNVLKYGSAGNENHIREALARWEAK